jgi:hypothetical protein
VILGVELRASHLLSRVSSTWATPPAHSCLILLHHHPPVEIILILRHFVDEEMEAQGGVATGANLTYIDAR